MVKLARLLPPGTPASRVAPRDATSPLSDKALYGPPLHRPLIAAWVISTRAIYGLPVLILVMTSLKLATS